MLDEDLKILTFDMSEKKQKIMSRFLLGLAFLCVSIIGVQCSQKPMVDLSEFGHDDLLNKAYLKGVVIDSTEMLNPFQIETYDDYLFVSEPNNLLVSVYDLNENKVVRKIINKGKGPEELLSISSLQVYNRNLVAYCAGTKVIHVYDIAQLFDSIFSPVKVIQIESSMCDNARMLNDSVIVYNSAPPARVVYDLIESDSIYRIGDYSFLNNINHVPDTWLSQVFRNRMVCNGKSGKYALFNMFTDVVEFYEDTSLVKVLIGPDKFDADLELHNSGNISMVRGKLGSTRDAYRSVYSNDEYIFASYSGTFVKDERYSLDQIFVFDWNGEPISRVLLDLPIESFCINFKNKKLLGFNFQMGYPRLISYDLTDLLDQLLNKHE